MSEDNKRQKTDCITRINTTKAPAAIGPYSQACVANGFAFVSGCIPLIAETGKIIEGDVKDQTRLVLTHLQSVVEASGSTLNQVCKVTIFVKSMNDFSLVNEIYSEFFGECKPARACVEVSRLPRDVLVEMDCVAVVSL